MAQDFENIPSITALAKSIDLLASWLLHSRKFFERVSRFVLPEERVGEKVLSLHF